MFFLHLAPDGIHRLDTIFNLVADIQIDQGVFQRLDKLLEQFLTIGGSVFQFAGNFFVFLRMFVLETEVFQLRFDTVQAQTMRQRRVEIKRFAGNLVTFLRRLSVQGTHIVQTVGHLDENHADIFCHG